MDRLEFTHFYPQCGRALRAYHEKEALRGLGRRFAIAFGDLPFEAELLRRISLTRRCHRLRRSERSP